MKQYLVIAHYDGDRAPLKQALQGIASQGESSFHLIVPATPAPTDKWTWSEEKSYEAAKQRLASMLGDIGDIGAPVTGDVVNYSELGAVEEALQTQPYDELIVVGPPDAEARTKLVDFENLVRTVRQVPVRLVVIDGAKPVERA